MMRLSEALRELENGKKIRHLNWVEHTFMQEESLKLFLQSKYFQLLEDPFNGWMIYQEPERTYSFPEVVKGLREGKRFRRKHWNTWIIESREDFIYLEEDGKKGLHWISTLNDFEAEDWVLVR